MDSAAAIAASSVISRQVSMQEWLGPLSAIALSPFFGLACLSGAATFGPDWLTSRSSMLGDASPLNNSLLFWLMLGLTIATSLPRLTKVSKPFALAVEKLEMYSAVIILISMKFMSGDGLPAEQGILPAENAFATAGLATMPLDVLFSIAAALNILIVNTIKLAIEVLVWLIPFPAIDAMLELGNKSLCAMLMALYAYSPLLSTVLNLSILGISCLFFLQVRRRLIYLKELLLWPLLRRLLGRPVDDTKFTAFLARSWNAQPAKSAFTVARQFGGDQVILIQRGWFKTLRFSGIDERTQTKPGLICDRMVIQIDGVDVPFDIPKGLIVCPSSVVIA